VNLQKQEDFALDYGPATPFYSAYAKSIDEPPGVLKHIPGFKGGWLLGDAIFGDTISGMQVNRGQRLLGAGMSVAEDWATLELMIAGGELAGNSVKGINQMLNVNADMLAWSVRHELSKQVYLNALKGAGASERAGLEYMIERMAWENWRLSANQFKRAGNQGLDLFFEGASENTGLHAVGEAKSGVSLSRLKTLKSGKTIGLDIRQGGQYYLGWNLETYIAEGGSNPQLAREMIFELQRAD
jgi:hypothetical protein